MVLIGLLLVALLCIALGVVFASGPWFIGSLVASALAGYVLWRQREQISGRAGRGASSGEPRPATASRQTSLVTGTAFTGKTSAEPASEKAAGSGGAPTPDASVWVVDGQPQYHSEACGLIEGLDAEAVPYVQAVEDGFLECPFCQPVVAARVNQVWVVDGHPEYHATGCSHLADAAGEHIPRAQAVEDGFTPCPDCRPDSSAAATAPPAVDEPAVAETASEPAVAEPAAEPAVAETASEPAVAEPAAEPAVAETASEPAVAEAAGAAPVTDPPADAPGAAAAGDVWVVDGRPRYHLGNCMIIEGQPAEPIPLAQATEDGFMPCSMCEPNVTRV